MIATIVRLPSSIFSLKVPSTNLHGPLQLVYFAALAYFLFKLVRIYDSDQQRRDQYKPAAKTLTVFAVITIVLLLITIFTACWCTHNFGKGLKPHLGGGRGRFGRRSAKRVGSSGDVNSGLYAGDKVYLDPMPPAGVPFGGPGGGSRMTID
jgi:hypothetical protein